MIVGIVVGVALVGALLVGVLHRGSSSTARSRALSTHLLALSDLPSGWSQVPPGNPLQGTSVACLGDAPGGPGQQSDVPVAARGFRSAAGVPNLVEKLEQYSPTGAEARWNQLMGTALHGCRPAAVATQPSVQPAVLSVLVRPLEGDQSASFSIPLPDGTTVGLLMARVGGTIMTLQLVSSPGVDISLFQLASSAATTKLLS
jgi:hypothetical protein